MENKINFLDIENFKSIRKLHLDCKRVNIFIGEPNVGRSNILEILQWKIRCNELFFYPTAIESNKESDLIFDIPFPMSS